MSIEESCSKYFLLRKNNIFSNIFLNMRKEGLHEKEKISNTCGCFLFHFSWCYALRSR
jgi:hypothetical protein